MRSAPNFRTVAGRDIEPGMQFEALFHSDEVQEVYATCTVLAVNVTRLVGEDEFLVVYSIEDEPTKTFDFDIDGSQRMNFLPAIPDEEGMAI